MMFMADLVMNYQSIYDLKREVSTMEEEFSELLTNLDALVGNINGKWRGKAQVEFATAYSELQPKLETMYKVLHNYATALSSIASNQNELEQTHATMFSNVGIPSF